MFDPLFSSLKRSLRQLFFQGQNQKQLALQIENKVCQLANFSPAEKGERNLVSILRFTNQLLENLIESAHSPLETQTSINSSLNQLQDIQIDLEPSATVKQLIKLRDLVLLAKHQEDNNSLEIMEGIYQQLGKILTKEGVTTLEEMGLFNYEHQTAIATAETENPNQDEWICETLRPGYLFDGKVIRPQEVIVYTYVSRSQN